MSTPKRHHEIRKMLSRNFADKNGLLHCYRKEDDKAFETTPVNVFVPRRLYSKRGEDGAPEDASKERELAVQVEGPANPVIERIVTHARARRLPGLTRQERYASDLFSCVQCRRTAASRRELEDNDLVKSAGDAVERIAGPLSGEERAQIDGSPDRRWAAVSEAWIDTLTLPLGDLFQALRGKGLQVLVLEDPVQAFIIGDDPIFPMIPPGATLKPSRCRKPLSDSVGCRGGVLGPLPRGRTGLAPGGR